MYLLYMEYIIIMIINDNNFGSQYALLNMLVRILHFIVILEWICTKNKHTCIIYMYDNEKTFFFWFFIIVFPLSPPLWWNKTNSNYNCHIYQSYNILYVYWATPLKRRKKDAFIDIIAIHLYYIFGSDARHQFLESKKYCWTKMAMI